MPTVNETIDSPCSLTRTRPGTPMAGPNSPLLVDLLGQLSISVDPNYNQSQLHTLFDEVDELILELRC